MTRSLVVGSKAIGLAVAREVGGRVLTFDDHEDSRTKLPALRDLGAEVIDPRMVAEEFADADLVIVAGWYWKLPPSSPQRRIIGLHNSLLPKYRGGSPLVWAMIRGEPVVGVSLFELTDQMDAGPVWGRASTEVGADETVGEVQSRLQTESVGLIQRFLNGDLQPSEQDESSASYVVQRRPRDGEIDWRWPAQRVHDFVRAQSRPYPGAFSQSGSDRVTIWRTRLRPERVSGMPGQRWGTNVIVCGDEQGVEIVDPIDFELQ